MAIQQSGKWWRGDTRADFEAFLRQAFAEDLKKAVFPECDGCGCLVYRLGHKPEKAVRRSCVACGASQGICGTDEGIAPSESLDRITCDCGKNQFEIAVGFAGVAGGRPRAAIARRCLACGVMDVVHQWSLPEGETEAILDRA